MKYSIRGLLAFTLLVILAMILWRYRLQTTQARARLATLHGERNSLEEKIRVHAPRPDEAVVSQSDELESLQAIRVRAAEHIGHLLNKYGAIEPPGPGTVAVRAVPSLPSDDSSPVAYKTVRRASRPRMLSG
jgi:hypothetical protein